MMSEKTPCTECGIDILPSTAERTGGLCMPCKNSTRESIETSKAYYKKERELDKTCPFRALWRNLVDKVHKKENGFAALSEEEKLFYSVNLLLDAVYRGGFDAYFNNSSGDYYRYADLGLTRLDATKKLKLLRQAKEALFGTTDAPQSQTQRWEAMKNHAKKTVLDALDDEFYNDKDTEAIYEKLETFAIDNGLVESA